MDFRPDTSDNLVHFTSGAYNDAFDRLLSIIRTRCIRGSGEKIKGGYQCVCFTEAPLTSLQHGLVNPTAYSRYAPFGVIFDKRWVFAQGGRPVIYQAADEFSRLPEDMRWRHVRYEPNGDRPVDFTWEREWRIHCESLSFDGQVAGIIVPSKEWADRFVEQHEEEQDLKVQAYSQVLDDQIAEQYREGFGWHIYFLA